MTTPAIAQRTASFCQTLTGLSLGLLVVCVSAGVVDDRFVEGAPTWAKPAKFAASFVILFATLAWLETRLSDPWRTGWILQTTTLVMALSMFAEMGYLMYQAALAEPSHFNHATPFHAFMYTVVMFVGALLLVTGIGIFGYAAARDTAADLSPGLRAGVIWGFALSFVFTLVLASYMSGQPTRLVGTPPSDPQTVPFLGWSLNVGDFRPSHFLSLHAMQVLPLLGWALDRYGISNPQFMIRMAALLYATLTLGIFAQALLGLPLTAFST